MPVLMGVLLSSSVTSVLAQAGGLPPVSFPAENPFSIEKSALGKALFWDVQLSSDNTTSCGSCHIPAQSGTDPRRSVHPGPDAVFGNDDDVVGSPGVSLTGQDDTYLNSVLFGLLPQATPRQ
ncbi:unnamed protein product, partial [Laminaria digitata]